MNRQDMESFERDVEARRQAGYGHKESGNSPRDAWEEIAQGRNLGKSVPINFVAAGAGQSLKTVTAEILRIMPKSDRADIARQVSVTVAPPQFIPSANVPAGVLQQSIQGQDAVANASTQAFPNGGFPVGGQALVDLTQWTTSLVAVDWGIGAVSNRAIVDCSNGLTLNLTTSWVIVTAILEQPPGTNPSPGVYIIGANVGPGTPSVNSARRSIILGNVASGVRSSFFAIPRFSKHVRVAASDGDPAAPNLAVGTIQFFADPTGLIPMGDFAFNGNQTNPIPIPNGVYYFAVVSQFNKANTLAPLFTAIFDLNL